MWSFVWPAYCFSDKWTTKILLELSTKHLQESPFLHMWHFFVIIAKKKHHLCKDNRNALLDFSTKDIILIFWGNFSKLVGSNPPRYIHLSEGHQLCSLSQSLSCIMSQQKVWDGLGQDTGYWFLCLPQDKSLWTIQRSFTQISPQFAWNLERESCSDSLWLEIL